VNGVDLVLYDILKVMIFIMLLSIYERTIVAVLI